MGNILAQVDQDDLKLSLPLSSLKPCTLRLAAVAEAKAKARVSMEKYLASLAQREEEGWSVLAHGSDEHFFSSTDELEQVPPHFGGTTLDAQEDATMEDILDTDEEEVAMPNSSPRPGEVPSQRPPRWLMAFTSSTRRRFRETSLATAARVRRMPIGDIQASRGQS